MKKDLSIIGGLFLLIVFLLFFGQGFTSVGFLPKRESTSSASSSGLTEVSANTLNVRATVASDSKERQRGLSGKDSLPLDEGMLFVFEESGVYPFWMKDMKFSIDIIWIDEEKRIVQIVDSALPQSGRDDSELTIYRPGASAKYVLEINAGLSRLHNLQVGSSVNFEL